MSSFGSSANRRIVQRGRGPLMFAVALLAMLIAAPAWAQTPQLRVRGQTKYVHGINVAWFVSRYSNDIGLNPLYPSWGTGYNGTTYGLWLDDMKRMNVNVLRLWLHEDLEGLNFDSSGYVSGLQSQFLTNLDDLMSRANSKGLAFELVLHNHLLKDQWGKVPPGAGAIKNFVADTTARQRYIDNALRPLVSRYNNNLAVFGYDLINESNIGADNGSYNWSQMRSFASACTSAIHGVNNTIQVTMSTQWWAFGDQANHPGWYGGLGLDYYTYHEYSDSPNLGTKPAWLEKPLVLGEYGAASGSDTAQNNATNTYITQAKDRGWAGTMAWVYYNASGDTLNIARTAGGNSDWRPAGTTIKNWGTTFGIGNPPPGAYTIYGDSLASDWANWSWSTTVNLANTSPVRGTRSISADSTAGWSAVSLRKGTAQSTSGYTSVKFWVHGGTGSNKALKFYSQTTDSGPSSPSVNFTATVNTWNEITIPLSSLGNPTTIKRINFQNNTGSEQGVIYLDDVRLSP